MKKYTKIIFFIIIVFTGLILNKKTNWVNYLSDYNRIKEYVNHNYTMSLITYLIFTILGSSILALPGVTFAILSSSMFGPWLGSLYCLMGTTIGATTSFILSRYFLKEYIEELIKKSEKLYNIIYSMDPDKETLVLLITRLLPIFPFNLQNFAYGITNISIAKYIIGTFIFMIPGIIVFSIGTAGITNKDNRMNLFLIAGCIVFVATIIGFKIYKKYKLLIIREKNER